MLRKKWHYFNKIIECDFNKKEHKFINLKGYETIPRINFCSTEGNENFIYVFGGKLINEENCYNELL